MSRRRRQERGLWELYRDDSERADALVFGRQANPNRRGFLKGAGLAAMGTMVGGLIPFHRHMPSGLIPAALAQTAPPAGAPPASGAAAAGGPKILKMDGKAGLVIIGDRPLVAETPEHLLDDEVTPNDKFFIRNNGQVPEPAANADAWEIAIDGEVNKPLKLTLGDLRGRFQPSTFRLQLECGGNGRSFYSPQARGNQWTNGGVGHAEWTGVRLADVLKAAGVKPSAVYTAHYGGDPHLSGDRDKDSLSRGLPIAKAMEQHTLIAFRMNGQPIPNIHGFPVRLVAPGYPGSASHKWLKRIWVRDKVHDGQGMGGNSYRVNKFPVVPGSSVKEEDTEIMRSMPVRSIITNPANGAKLPAGTRQLALRGHAWAGERSVKAVHVSINFGASWAKAALDEPKNKYAWQSWRTTVALPSKGYYEVWVRATDSRGRMQPHVAGDWNPQGYGGNPMHRVAVLVEA
jgi:DMSO/TMAO reductase YedYZ molybdopterin-dependent catalytic subunit